MLHIIRQKLIKEKLVWKWLDYYRRTKKGKHLMFYIYWQKIVAVRSIRQGNGEELEIDGFRRTKTHRDLREVRALRNEFTRYWIYLMFFFLQNSIKYNRPQNLNHINTAQTNRLRVSPNLFRAHLTLRQFIFLTWGAVMMDLLWSGHLLPIHASLPNG